MLSAQAGRAQTTPDSSSDNSGGAASAPVPPAYYGGLSVAKGEGRLVKLPRAVANLFVADNSVAEVRPASPGTMFVFGKTLGETNIVATDQNGNRIAQYSVTVTPSTYASDRLQSKAQNLAPGSNVTAETEPGGMVVSGSVNTAQEADNVINRAKAISGGPVINNLTVNEPIQVELKVRIAEMSRTVTRQLGVNWSSVGDASIQIGKFMVTGSSASSSASISGATPGGVAVTWPGGTFEGIIDALAEDNLAHVMAEPTLTTLSGTQASFQVGGQFPVPVSSGNNSTSVSYKSYGVILTFTPTVFSDGRIALQVSPEFSEINAANSATVSTGSSESITVPSVTIASATSTIILGSGQGMAIAGLLQDTTSQVDNGVPGLSEIPVVGALFRGDSFQRQQQELVITVTPYLVNPVNNPNSLAMPDDGWTPANDLQRILLLRQNGTNTPTTSIPGDAGFMVQ
jgi:pilus assembly protein CpaC